MLHYPEFAPAGDEIKTIVEDDIMPSFDVIDIGESVNGVSGDPYDDTFLSIAASACTAWIVTGDKYLLEIVKY